MLTKRQHLCLIQKKTFWINILVSGLIFASLTNTFHSYGQIIKSLPEKSYAGYSKDEALWASIDFQKLKQDVSLATGLSATDQSLFFDSYIGSEKYPDERFDFFRKTTSGEINETSLNAYVEGLKQKYISVYPDFIRNKQQFAEKIREINSAITSLAANGPCTNIDFEEGTTNGWSGIVANACTNPTPCGPFVNGIDPARHVITNTSMTDPFIPALPVVAPGGNFSLKLEDYDKGGKASIIRQTFAVTPTNNLFTYRYAAVLEDPGDHDDDERPYFKVRLYDQNGKEIKCASYTAIAKPPLQNFTYVKSAGKNLYYRNWSTVSLPLDAYQGQNVTIEFIASDCALGAHLGYAYIDGACSSITPMPEVTLCNSSTTNLKATDGFASYKWAGPGIVGSNNQQTVKVNKGGTYTVTLTPFADNPCPTTQSVNVYERCLPPPIKVSLCETVKGSGTATKVNLLNYNTAITAYHAAPVSVKSWHSAFPATTANIVATPSSLTVSASSKFYAVIDYGTLGGDTAELGFKINSLPSVVFPNITPVCKGSSSFQITGVSPSGGVFSGTNVTATGNFNPITNGSFNVKYLYIDANGCKDSLTKPAVVQAPPTIDAGQDQTLCASATKVDLTGTRTIATGAHWSGGAGTYSPHVDSVKTSYTPTSAEKTGSLTLTLTSTGNGVCPAVSDNVKITFIPVPTANAGPDQTLCASTTTVTLAPAFTNNSTQNWSGGSGTISADLKTYTPTATEINTGTVTLKLTANGNTPCAAVNDDVVIKFSPIPTVNAGPDQTLCANNNTATLAALVTNMVTGSWSGGGGSFSASNNASSTYTPTAAETSAGTVTLTFTNTGKSPCPAVKDDLILKIIPAPTVNAGPDQTLCASAKTITLAPAFTNSSTQSWTGGSGSVSTDLKTYTPTATEISAGTITLHLTANGNTPCAAVNDDITIKFNPGPTVNAGVDQNLCSNNTTATLAATVTNMVTGSWSGGNGSFSAVNSINSTYTPTTAEVQAGTVTLTFTNTGQNQCPPAKDELVLKIIPEPTVNAGPDQTICASATTVTLVPVFTNSSTQSWSGGSGSTSTDLKTYTPTAAEISSGAITLKLTANGNTPCAAIDDDVIIKFSPIPTVDAGPDQTLCANNNTATLAALVTNMVTGSWSGGGGSFSASNNASSTYTPTTAETSTGTVTLTFTNNGQTPCPAVKDDLVLKIIPAPTVNAGPDQTLCASATTVALLPAYTNSSTQSWSGGSGSTSTDLKTYTPTSAEINAGTITLKLTASGNTPCAAVNDDVTIKFSPVPTVDAGPDQNVCEDNASVTLNAVPVNLVSGKWTGGSGSFSDDTDPKSTYNPTQTEIQNGVVKLTYTNNGQNPCPAVTDEVIVSIIKLPIANAGPDFKVCQDTTINLNTTAIPNVSYSWDDNGNVIGNGNSINYTVNKDGLVTLTATDNFGCKSTDKASISTVVPPILSLAGPYCFGTGLELKGTLSNTSAGKIEWFRNGELIANKSQPNLTVDKDGSYTIRFTYGSCSRSAQTNVFAPPVLDKLKDLTLCEATKIPLVVNQIPGGIYQWKQGNTPLAVNGNNTEITVVTGPQKYHVQVSDVNACIAIDSILITGIPLPKVAVRDTAVCSGATAQFNAIVSNLNQLLPYNPVYTWKKDGSKLSGSGDNISAMQAGIYSISVNAQGCEGNSQAVLRINPLPEVNAPSTVKFCDERDHTAILDAGSGYRYHWTASNDSTRTITVSTPGIYHFKITDQNNCSSIGRVTLENICPPRLFVADAFTPDGDGINDLYNVYGAHIGTFHMLIFNRWGEIIFESKDRTHVWDGIYKDEPMQSGVYPWVITYEGDTEQYKGPYNLKGSVTVVR